MKARENVEKMQEYKPPSEGRRGMLRLDFNENTLGPSPKAGGILRAISMEFLSIYPEYTNLTKAIATYCKAPEAWVLPCNGSDETIRIAMVCFVDKGEEIIIVEPTFAMFRQYAEAAGARIRRINYNKDLSFPANAVLGAINRKTKMIVLCNPNNPTGAAISRKTIERILKKAKDAVVFVDEAYYEFSGATCIGLLRKYENLVISRTLSKAFGLAGLRVGYAISNAANIKLLRRVSSPYPISSLSAEIAVTALQKSKYMKRYVKEIKKSKILFEAELKKRRIKYFPSEGNFVLAYFGENCKRICVQLRKRGILIRNRSKDKMLDGCARITIGTQKQMKILLKALDGIMQKPLLIFDIDGVLIDVSKSYRKAIQKTVESFTGRNISPAEIQAFKIKSLINNDWELSKKIIESLDFKVKLDDVIGEFQLSYLGKNFNGFIRNEKLLIKKNILEKLSEDYDLSIFTGRPREEAEYALRRFGIFDSFGKIVAMEDTPKGKEKPNPFGLRKILGNSKNAFYFGDTIADIICAKRAGIKAVGVLPPQDKSVKLKRLMLKNGACGVLQDINEVAI